MATAKVRKGNIKLSETDVRNIRLMAEKGIHDKKIAEMFGVSHSCIQLIRTRRTWTHVR